MSMTVLDVPEQGHLVRVWSRQWVVNEVKPSTLSPPAVKPSFDGSQNLITLASKDNQPYATTTSWSALQIHVLSQLVA